LLEDWFKLWPLGEPNAEEKEAGKTDRRARLKYKKKVSRYSPEKRKNTKLTRRSKSKIGSRIILERAREACREGDATC
jgi:hypothetical protein